MALLTKQQKQELRMKAQISGIALIPYVVVLAIIMWTVYINLSTRSVSTVTSKARLDVLLWVGTIVLYYGLSLGLMYVPMKIEEQL